MWICSLVLVLWIGIIIGLVAGRLLPSQQNVGEALVANAITANLKRPHLLLNNVTLPNGEGTSQIDHILVSETGILVIETKHYSGWIFGNCHADRWTQVKFSKKSKFQNPVRQNYGHVKALQALFNLPGDAFSSLVVFTGDAELKTDLGPAVIKLAQLAGYLSSERKVLFDERQMTYIVGRIEMKRLRRSLETDEYHLSRIRRRVKALH